MTPNTTSVPSANSRHFSQAVDAIGCEQFAPQLLMYLNKAVHAEHCVLYRFNEDHLEVLGSASIDGSRLANINSARYRNRFWQRDAIFTSLMQRLCGYESAISCVPAEQITDPEFRHEMFLTQGLSGRAMLLGDRASGAYGISLFRRSEIGFFSQEDNNTLASIADTLVSCVAKHGSLVRAQDFSASPLHSAEAIELRLLALAPSLTQRERQVCARLVFGLEVKETAKDLGISPESAVTYRKRAYLRLGVTTRAELLRNLLNSHVE